MTPRTTTERTTDRRYMPRLTSSLNGCVRWRWSDLEDLLDTQMRMLEDMLEDETSGREAH